MHLLKLETVLFSLLMLKNTMETTDVRGQDEMQAKICQAGGSCQLYTRNHLQMRRGCSMSSAQLGIDYH